MPSAVERLAALGVRPEGHRLRGIRYLSSGHSADALFRGERGLGVRRIALQPTLSERAELRIPVVPGRVTAFRQYDDHVTARCGPGDGTDGFHAVPGRR
jgi:hypothetical protein